MIWALPNANYTVIPITRHLLCADAQVTWHANCAWWLLHTRHSCSAFSSSACVHWFDQSSSERTIKHFRRQIPPHSRTLRYESLCFFFKAISLVSLPALALILLRQLTLFISIWLLPLAEYGCQMVLAGIGQRGCLHTDSTHTCPYHNLKPLPVLSGTSDSKQGKDRTGKTWKNQERLKSSAQVEVTLIYGTHLNQRPRITPSRDART